MVKKNGSLFGNIFDLNGDGVTDALEAALGFMIIEEMEDEEDFEQSEQMADLYDLDALDDLDDWDPDDLD